jgi:hypothetical protein
MTTNLLHPVDDFARAVRAALADLPADEVDDLTDGLEADLTERAADEESPEFGDPVAYASELRAAAGFPPRGVRRSSSMGSVFGRTWTEFLRGVRELQKHPLIARLFAFLVAIRPLWWTFRAWVFYGIVCWAFGIAGLNFNFGTFLIGAACLIVSVQLGRGKWQPRSWIRATLLAVNVVLVLTIPIALLATSFAFNAQYGQAYAEGITDSSLDANGLVYNGRQVTNIFAYDASGKPLTDVQLFDQKGKPLNTVPDSAQAVSDPPLLVPNGNVIGRRGWNVYPLESITADQLNDHGLPKKGTKPKPVTPTFLIVAPLANSSLPTPSPTPTATPAPAPTN